MIVGLVQHFQGPQTLYSRARPLTVGGAKVAGATAMGLATAWQSKALLRINQPINQALTQNRKEKNNDKI